MLGDYGGCRKTPTTTLHCGSGSPGPCRRALPRRPNSGDENRRGEASRRLRQHRQHRSRADECPNPGGCFPPRIEMSWQPVLTALTALTMVARSPIPRAYPDRPGPRSTLAGERYFDAQHAKERLRTTQPSPLVARQLLKSKRPRLSARTRTLPDTDQAQRISSGPPPFEPAPWEVSGGAAGLRFSVNTRQLRSQG
jgi:hypothetical protein